MIYMQVRILQNTYCKFKFCLLFPACKTLSTELKQHQIKDKKIEDISRSCSVYDTLNINQQVVAITIYLPSINT